MKLPNSRFGDGVRPHFHAFSICRHFNAMLGVPNTPLAIALKETMDYFPKLEHTYDKCDYTLQLEAIEQAIDRSYAELLKAVTSASSHRERLPIDQRMNIEPSNYFLFRDHL